MLLKMIGYGTYSDGTFSLLIVPMYKPEEGQTLKQANGADRPAVTTEDCVAALQGLMNNGFCIIAEHKDKRDFVPESGIILG